MTLGQRLRELLDSLPAGWTEARVVVSVGERADADRAALVLGSLSPGRSGGRFTITVTWSGIGGPSVDAAARVLDRLEQDGVDARLSLPGTAAFAVAPRAVAHKEARPLAEHWDALSERLPDDWSDVYLELELASSDDVDRAALHLSPVNPFLHGGVHPIFRFRAAHRFGYGAAPEMLRRVLGRLDEAHVTGTLRLLRVQSDVRPVLTQGPVWREGGRAI